MSAAHIHALGGRSRFLDLDGQVHLTEYGEPDAEETLVCLHGLGGSALNFALVAHLLADGRRIIVPDLLGHGRSRTPVPGEGALDAQLAMLRGLLLAETDAPVVLVGHSMGGVLAELHAVRAPGTVERLVLIDPPVPNVTRWKRDPRLTTKLALLRFPGMGALVARQVTRMTPEQLVERQLGDATPYAARIPKGVVDATVAEVLETRGEDGGSAAQRAQFQAILEVIELLARPAAWREQLAEITVPTLWLQGVDDPLARLEPARALAESRPHWAFRTRDRTGHLPHLEDPAWTADAIIRWLSSGARS